MVSFSYTRRRQSGAFALSFILVVTLLLLCVVVALDTGRLFLEQRRLQTVADSAAMEAVARSGLGAGGQQAASLQLFAEESATRNGFAPGQWRTLRVERGRVFQQDGLRVFSAADAGDALRVVAEHEVRTSLLANLAALVPGSEISPRTRLRAEAVARRGAFGAFSAGTRLLGLNTESSPLLGPLLSGLLGTQLDLDLLSPAGLLDTRLSLLELVEGVAVAGVELTAVGLDGVLQAGVTVAELLEISLEILQQREGSGEPSAADLALLSDLQSAARNSSTELQQISLEQLLRLRDEQGSVPDGALDARLRLGDLLGVALLAANREKGLSLNIATGQIEESLEGEEVDKLSLLDLVVHLGVIEPPQIAIGPPGRLAEPDGNQAWKTEVMSPQLSLMVGAKLNIGLAELDLGLRVDAGSGKAALESIRLAEEGTQRASVLAKPALAAVHLGSLQSLSAPFQADSLSGSDLRNAAIDPVALRLLGSEETGSLAAVTIAASSVAAQSGDLVVRDSDPRVVFEGPPWPAPPVTVTGAAGESLGGLLGSLLRNLDINVYLLGGDKKGGCGLLGLGCLLDWIVNEVVLAVLDPLLKLLALLLEPLLTALGTVLIDPLLGLLGIELGSMEVQMLDVQLTEVELVL